MVSIELIARRDAPALRDARLRALQDAPSAFGSTYAKESQLTDDDWQERADRWSGRRCATFLALDSEMPCGIAGCFLDSEDALQAHLVSMWVSSSHRRTGVGRALVNAALDWARTKRVQRLCLMVTSNNDPAIGFYRSLEFSFTGRTEPYPNDPNLFEHEMCRQV